MTTIKTALSSAAVVAGVVLASATSAASAAPRIAFDDATTSDGADSAVFTIRPDGTGIRQLTSGPTDEGPVWSPDRTEVAFTRRVVDTPEPFSVVMVVAATGGEPVSIDDGASVIAWVGNRLLLRRQADLTYYTIKRNRTGVRSVHTARPGTIQDWSSANHRLAYLGHRTLFSSTVNGGDEQRVAGDAITATRVAGSTGASWSPNGNRIAYIRRPRDQQPKLCVIRSDGTDRRCHERPAGVGSPRWSPDGGSIAYDSRLDDHPGIYTIRADLTHRHRIHRFNFVAAGPLDW
jgi:Tol biopolymer transport system component